MSDFADKYSYPGGVGGAGDNSFRSTPAVGAAGGAADPQGDPLATPIPGCDDNSLLSRRVACPECGHSVTLPWLWVAGVEVVVRCPECRRGIKTGYKMGAVLMGLALTVAVALANFFIWMLGSWSTLIFAALLVPGWIFSGFVARKWWLRRRTTKN